MSINDWICLNVGGTPMSTTRSTLVSAPGSVLALMFDPSSPRPPARQHDGTFLIDTCPVSFAVILNFLRYKELMLPSTVTAKQVKVVAAYFGVDALVKLLDKTEADREKAVNWEKRMKVQAHEEIVRLLRTITHAKIIRQ